MDEFKLKQIKRQSKLNQIVNQVIKQNTDKLKVERKICQKEEKILLSKKEASYTCTINKKYENRLPYMLLGLIESVFINEKTQKEIKEYGCGLLLETNIVLLPAKNLVYEVERNPSSSEQGENKKKIVKINPYKLKEVSFSPFNISDKYRLFLPQKIKVVENFTPLTLMQHAQETSLDEGNFLNSWGLAVLDFPLGDFLNYIEEEQQGEYMKRNLKKNIRQIEGNYFSSGYGCRGLVEVKPIESLDLFNSVIFFLESNSKNNFNAGAQLNEDEYLFSENFYDIKFDENLIFLRSLSNVNDNIDKILPGVILSYFNKKYYLIGMNTNIIIKTDDRVEGSSHNLSPSNHSNKCEVDHEPQLTHRIGFRFNKEILNSISEKIEEIKSTPRLLPYAFSPKLFKIFVRNFSSREIFLNHLRDNCKNLIEFIKRIKSDIGLSLSDDEKQMLTFSDHNQSSEKENITPTHRINFIYFSLSLIWNKLTHLNSDNTLDLSSLNFGLYPGTEIIAEMLKNCQNLQSLNLNSNQIFSNGIKYLIKPIFNRKSLNIIGKDLKHIHLDNNKLNSKALKYLRHLLKATTSLKSLTLNHNYISADGLKYLLNSLKSKEELTRLELSFNMLGKKSGIYLNEILRGLVNLQILDLQSNNLTDSSIPFIFSALKENKALQSLYLGNNSITKASAISISQYLNRNKNLLRLWLDSNNLSSEGVGIIGKSLAGAYDVRGLSENSEVVNKNDDRRLLSSLPTLSEINLANVHAEFDGTQMFFNYLKKNKNISRIIFHSNNIGDIGCINIAEYLSTQAILDDEKASDYVNNILKEKSNDNDEDCDEYIYNNSECDNDPGLAYLSLSNNNITDDGAKILAEQFLKHKHLKEIKLNSNLISDAGAELLLYSVLCNNSIIKFNIENNNTTWRDKNIDIKNIRSNIQIFF